MNKIEPIIEDRIEFFIIDNILMKMINPFDEQRDVIIPHVFKNGEKITAISGKFCEGKFGKITISDGIKMINESAFRDAKCTEVRWSSGCSEIPVTCFDNCTLTKLTNIDNVDNIEMCAFALSWLTELTWPSKCKDIPPGCFMSSRIKTITNIDHVESIGGNAFDSCVITHFNWPSGCKIIPRGCFQGCTQLETVSNLSVVSHIEKNAFADCSSIESLDFSGAVGMTTDTGAFVRAPREKIIFPYYSLQEAIESSFRKPKIF